MGRQKPLTHRHEHSVDVSVLVLGLSSELCPVAFVWRGHKERGATTKTVRSER